MVGEEFEAFVERWVQRIRDEVPDAVAVFLAGSHVRGAAGPRSDVDFHVLVAEGPRDEWPLWFDAHDHGLVLVDVWIRDVARWLDSQEESQDWAFGLAAAEPLRLCWVADESWRARLDRRRLTHPAGEPELGHFISALGKVVNAHRQGDELALRLAAQDLGVTCPGLLGPLNPRPPAESRHTALLTALNAGVTPTGYRDDLLICLGLTGGPMSARDLYATACRLATGVVDLLSSHTGTFTRLLPQQLSASLIDGTLRRYVAQLVTDPEGGASRAQPTA